MNYTIKTSDPLKLPAQCLVLGVFQANRPKLTPLGLRLDQLTGKRISRILLQGDLSAEVGSSLLLHDLPGIRAARVLLTGLGKAADFDRAALAGAATAATRCLQQSKIKAGEVCLLDAAAHGLDTARRTRIIVEAMQAALYHYDATKSARKPPQSLKRVTITAARGELAAARTGLAHGQAVAGGVELARELGNLPGNLCTPKFLARHAKTMQKTHGLKVTILDEADMKRLKMGSLLSVSRGSREPARLIVIEHRGGARTQPPVVLVGKGLTFDAGGISIKPSNAMDEMKFDMCGGASVFGALQAVAEIGLAANVIGIVPSSENLPDGAANKPGDIVTAMNGTTIEILNTDAEGRLILCDALTYAERYKPATVIDIATLTGACVVALGSHASGLFSDNDKLARQLLEAGDAAGDRAWRLPVWDDYARQLKSNFADLANIGSGRDAGAVTAACFLRHFTRKFDWAHLDVAGTAWDSGSAKGATGRPVPLLVEFLLNR